jgi:hypothetical protein
MTIKSKTPKKEVSFFAAHSQQRVFRSAYEHFAAAGALLNQKQFLKNTAKRLVSAGMTPRQAEAQAKLILDPEVKPVTVPKKRAPRAAKKGAE